MQRNDDLAKTNTDDTQPNPLWGRLALLMFGLTVLAFLTAIDRPEWFRLKPATGTAAAMVYASDHRS
ncbi:hypothetical protein M9979_12050 [Sphingomonas sp. RP10(2022)]|uniref:Uncharacterized protein n=1 Tax=Sphingomonas liriopis TaxID=2949094 RepID=A0A9X2HZC1_9SPHN|nr:hypothetical protein [Sphingomonas liriopis]MCP3735605.1 hypothetical protein [Sphingomonas liriopis]